MPNNEYESLEALEQTLRGGLDEYLASVEPDQWDEDHITLGIIDYLRDRLRGASIGGTSAPAKIGLTVYKARGKVETLYGDLAIVVDHEFADSSSYVGVAVLEAKKRKLGGFDFPAMKDSQIKTIVKNSASPYLLLYDREPIHSGGFDQRVEQWRDSYDGRVLQRIVGLSGVSRAVVVPMVAAQESGKKDIWLYRLSMPFSWHFCHRYLRGLDLDPSKTMLNSVRAQAGKLRVFKHVILLKVSHGRRDNSESVIEFNSDVYEKLDQRR